MSFACFFGVFKSKPTLHRWQYSDVEVSLPFPAVASWITTHITYLDSIGRPALIFQYKDLTIMHAQSIFVCFVTLLFTFHLLIFFHRCHIKYLFLLTSRSRSRWRLLSSVFSHWPSSDEGSILEYTRKKSCKIVAIADKSTPASGSMSSRFLPVAKCFVGTCVDR